MAVLIILGVAVSQGLLTSPTSPTAPSASPTVVAIAQASTSGTPSSSGAVKTASPTPRLDSSAALVRDGPLDPGTYAYLNVGSAGFNV